MALSPKEGDELAARMRMPDGGGFTYDTKAHRHFEGPGFAVAAPGAEARYPAGFPIVRSHIMEHERRHRDFLSRQGFYQGGWHDPVKGDRSLDVSQIFRDRRHANVAMVARGEDAMTNMSNYRSIRNPYKEALGRGQISQADYDAMAEGARSLMNRYPDPDS